MNWFIKPTQKVGRYCIAFIYPFYNKTYMICFAATAFYSKEINKHTPDLIYLYSKIQLL